MFVCREAFYHPSLVSSQAKGLLRLDDDALDWQEIGGAGTRQKNPRDDASGRKPDVETRTSKQRSTDENRQITDLGQITLSMSEHKKWLDKKSGGKQADFSKQKMEGQNFSGWELSKTLMSGTDFTGSSMKGANLTEADMFGATLSDVDFQNADLTGAVMRGASLRGANLTNANLTDADLRGGVMLGAGGEASLGSERSDLTQCLMDYAQGTRAKMSNVDFQGASLVGANLSGAQLFGSDLSDCDLSYADLRGADLSDTRLTNTNLNGSDLTGAQLSNATLENVSMRGVTIDDETLESLDRSQLDIGDRPSLVVYDQMAPEVRERVEKHQQWITSNGEAGERGSFDGMDLSYHDLSGRDLSGIQMRDGKLRGASLKGCMLVLADLGGTDIFDADLADAVLIGTNLSGTNLKRCNLTNAAAGEIPILSEDGTETGRLHKTNFQKANLIAANTTGCDFGECRMEKAIID